jgi:hypothetical protein
MHSDSQVELEEGHAVYILRFVVCKWHNKHTQKYWMGILHLQGIESKKYVLLIRGSIQCQTIRTVNAFFSLISAAL